MEPIARKPRMGVNGAGRAALLVMGAAGVLLASVANAQEFRGTILGRVTDPQGAAIPHVTVVVTNEATNVASESLSENDGAYAVPFLIPGKYKIETTLAGFKSFVRSGVTVGINQHATVDIKLELGNVTEIPDPKESIYFPRNIQLGMKLSF